MICLVRNTPKKSGLHFLAFISHPGNNQINNQMTYICNMSVFMLSSVLVILPAVLLADWIGWLSSPCCSACCLLYQRPSGSCCLSKLSFPALPMLLLVNFVLVDSICLVIFWLYIACLYFHCWTLLSSITAR